MSIKVMRYFLFIFTFALFFSACSEPVKETPKGDLKRYELRGKVISVDRANNKAEIDHEAIPDLMPRMTMNFVIKEDWVWDDLLPGAEIRAELVVDNTADDPYWLEKIGIVSAPNPDLPQPDPAADITGKEPPTLKLTNQDGKKFAISDYKGKALAITFIYRECPLPEACIQLSRNFSDLAIKIAADERLKDNIRLLSISFDPERDTPQKLREYGIGYLGNPKEPDFTVWQLAVGTDAEVREVADFFKLKYETNKENKAEINHTMVTAVIGPDGKVARIFSGGAWTNDELLTALRVTLE